MIIKNAEIFSANKLLLSPAGDGVQGFALRRVPFEGAKHPTRKASGTQSLLGHNAPRLSGGAPKPQWRKERKICSA